MSYIFQDTRAALRVYAITDPDCIAGRDIAACVADAIEGGATFIQLRDKGATTAQLVEQAQRILPVCRAAGVPFVIDDDVEAAIEAGVDGVHVGQSDMACAHAREVLGSGAIIGVSTQTVEQALAAQAAGADYLGVGAMFATSTKEAAVLTVDELRAIVDAVEIPVVAIGGIKAHNARPLMDTGIAGVSVVSAIFAPQDIKAAAAELAAALD
jgi:thiamine-phosphate diphosphorylase